MSVDNINRNYVTELEENEAKKNKKNSEEILNEADNIINKRRIMLEFLGYLLNATSTYDEEWNSMLQVRIKFDKEYNKYNNDVSLSKENLKKYHTFIRLLDELGYEYNVKNYFDQILITFNISYEYVRDVSRWLKIKNDSKKYVRTKNDAT